jgi:hypothetical protein
MGEGYATIQRGEGGGILMTNSAASVTSQRISFKYVMASEPFG